jgi:transposase
MRLPGRPAGECTSRKGDATVLFAGIDWSDKYLDFCLRSADGDELSAGRIEVSCQGLTELFLKLDPYGDPSQIAIAIETTHGPWIQSLLDRGYVVYPVNPKRSEAFRQSMSANGEKTDKIDARGLAMLLRTFHKDLHHIKPDDPEIVSLRIACQDRLRLVEERVAKGNELLSILKVHYPAFPGFFGDHTSKIALEFLCCFPTQNQMKSITPARLRKWLKTHSYNSTQRIDEMVEHLKAPALPVPEHLQRSKAPLVQYLSASILSLHEIIDEREKNIHRDFDQLPQADWAKSLPRAGDALEPSLLAIFGRDKNRFASVNEARALMGTGPVTKSSGQSRIVVFRRGCWKFARRTMHLFADQSRHACAWAREFYDRQRSKGKKHHEALRALAHKWVKIIWALVRTGQTYNEAVYVRSQTRYQTEAINRRNKKTTNNWT